MKIHGIRTCNTCRKALAELQKSGQDVVFRDVRDEPLGIDELERFHAEFGSALFNRRSKTWRDLPEVERSGNTLALIRAHPTLMKRPVIETAEKLHLGWGPEVRSPLLG